MIKLDVFLGKATDIIVKKCGYTDTFVSDNYYTFSSCADYPLLGVESMVRDVYLEVH